MKAIRTLTFLMVFMTCSSCDWDQSHIVGNYYLDGTDGHHWIIDGAKNKVVIEQQVVDVETSGRYLLVLRESAQSYECGPSGKQVIYTEYSGQLEYWVLDADSGEKSGPLDVKAYEAFLRSRGLPNVELEQTTEYVPYTSSPRIPRGLKKQCEPI